MCFGITWRELKLYSEMQAQSSSAAKSSERVGSRPEHIGSLPDGDRAISVVSILPAQTGFVEDLVVRLEQEAGSNVKSLALKSSEDLAGKVCVICEFQSSFLADMTPQRFESLQHLALSAKGIVWSGARSPCHYTRAEYS